jgi:hypothetical protein
MQSSTTPRAGVKPFSLIPEATGGTCPYLDPPDTAGAGNCPNPDGKPSGVVALSRSVDRAAEGQVLSQMAANVIGAMAQKAMLQATYSGGNTKAETDSILKSCKGPDTDLLHRAVEDTRALTESQLEAMRKQSEIKVARRREVFAAASRLGHLEKDLKNIQQDFDAPPASLQKLWAGSHLGLGAIAMGVPGLVAAQVIDLGAGTIDTMINTHQMFSESGRKNRPCSSSRGGLLGRHEKVKGTQTAADHLMQTAGYYAEEDEHSTAEERCETKKIASESISMQMRDLLRKYPELGERTDDPNFAHEVGEGISQGFRESWHRFSPDAKSSQRVLYQFIAESRKKLDQTRLLPEAREAQMQALFDAVDLKLKARRGGAIQGIRAAIGEVCANPIAAMRDRLGSDPGFAARVMSCEGRVSCPERKVLGPLVCELQAEQKQSDNRFNALSAVAPAVLDGLLLGTGSAVAAAAQGAKRIHSILAVSALGHQAGTLYKGAMEASASDTAAGYYYAGLNTQEQYDRALGAKGQFAADVAITAAALSPTGLRALGKLLGPRSPSTRNLLKVLEAEGERVGPEVSEEANKLGKLYEEADRSRGDAKRLKGDIEQQEQRLKHALVEHGLGKGASAPAVAAAEALPETLQANKVPADQLEVKRKIEGKLGKRYTRVISKGKVKRIETEYAQELKDVPGPSKADAINIIENLENRYRKGRVGKGETKRRIREFIEELKKAPCATAKG